jgi:hypothetical protein
MALEIFIITWVSVLLTCVYKVYFPVPYDKELEKLKKKK